MLLKFATFITTMFVLGSFPSKALAETSPSEPLGYYGLLWDKKYDTGTIPRLKSHSYYYGSFNYGTIIYHGKTLVLGHDSEIQLSVTPSGELSGAVLILGPSGINSDNCTEKYQDVVRLLRHKYGNIETRHIVEDPVNRDLVFNSYCKSVAIGAYYVDTIWKTKKYKIVASLLGDADGYFIEIAYTKLSVSEALRKKRLSEAVEKI